MANIRIGLIGLGNIGSVHIANMKSIEGATLAAVCDVDSAKLALVAEQQKLPAFATHSELLASGTCDAVLIAAPHYHHMPMAMEAFGRGVHVLVEKPLAVSIKAGRQGIEAYEAALKKHPDLKFGIMFNQRSNPMYQKLRELIAAGELGELSRITWLVTNWFRSHAYYAMGGWRATWKGEGGGVLINQCPHNLDLIQWITGLMPSRITGVGFVGKTHPIEVEDEISAILEFPNGAVGHFVTTTGEAPGTNRLEICGSRGKAVAENGKLTLWQTAADIQKASRETKDAFPAVETKESAFTYPAPDVSEHRFILQNFILAIRDNIPNGGLLSPGPEGIRGLEIGNAMMMAALTRRPVTLPVDGEAYDIFLEQMATEHAGRKSVESMEATANMSASFAK